jgi:hypothetical protein
MRYMQAIGHHSDESTPESAKQTASIQQSAGAHHGDA